MKTVQYFSTNDWVPQLQAMAGGAGEGSRPTSTQLLIPSQGPPLMVKSLKVFGLGSRRAAAADTGVTDPAEHRGAVHPLVQLPLQALLAHSHPRQGCHLWHCWNLPCSPEPFKLFCKPFKLFCKPRCFFFFFSEEGEPSPPNSSCS